MPRSKKRPKWSVMEEQKLLHAHSLYGRDGSGRWKKIAAHVGTRSDKGCENKFIAMCKKRDSTSSPPTPAPTPDRSTTRQAKPIPTTATPSQRTTSIKSRPLPPPPPPPAPKPVPTPAPRSILKKRRNTREISPVFGDDAPYESEPEDIVVTRVKRARFKEIEEEVEEEEEEKEDYDGITSDEEAPTTALKRSKNFKKTQTVEQLLIENDSLKRKMKAKDADHETEKAFMRGKAHGLERALELEIESRRKYEDN